MGTLAVIFVTVIWTGELLTTILDAHTIIAANPGARSTALDVAAFWSAARLALEGQPLAVFDIQALAEVQANADVGRGWALDWLYPPALLVLLMPLGALDFIGAWIALASVSVLAFHFALRRIVPGWPIVTLLVVFSPATLSCALRGQLTMLFASAALLGLDALMRGRKGRAAGWLALVTLKPQICLAFPVALVASRSWRLLVIGAAFVVGLAVVPLVVAGVDYWKHWLALISVHGDAVTTFVRYDIQFMSWQHLFTLAGVGAGAKPLGWGMILVTFAILALAWRRADAPVDLRAAALMFAMASAAPHAWAYEALLPLGGSVILLRAAWSPGGGAADLAWARPFGVAVFTSLWLGPIPALADLAPVAPFVLPPTLVGLIGTYAMIRGERSAQAARSAARH